MLHIHWQRYSGIALAFLSLSAFVVMDFCVQRLILIDPIDPVSIMLLRMILPMLVSYAYLYHTGAPGLPFGPQEHRWVLAVRGCVVFAVTLAFFYAFRHITISDAMVIFQCRPFLVGYLSERYLDEPMKGKQKLASGISVLGEVLVAKPKLLFSAGNTGVTAATSHAVDSIIKSMIAEHFIAWGLMLAGTLGTVADMLILRKIGDRVHPLQILATFSVVSIALSSLIIVVTHSPLVLPSSPEAWVMLVLSSILCFAAQVLITQALRAETAVTISLVSQLSPLTASVIDYMVYRVHFDTLSAIDATLTTAAGIVAIFAPPEASGFDHGDEEAVEGLLSLRQDRPGGSAQPE